MERRNLALLCAGVLCFWLFALAFGTAEGRGVAVQAELPTAAPAAVEDVPVVAAAEPELPGGHSGGSGHRYGAVRKKRR